LPELAILAAGVGKRLFPVTCITPKPLVPLTDRISNVLNLLDKFLSSGIFDRVHIVLGYIAIPFAEYLHKIFEKNQKVNIVISNTLRGTAGQLCDIVNNVNDDLLIVNGDVFIDDVFVKNLLDITNELICRSDFDLCIITSPLRIKYGVIESVGEKFIKWVEKPTLNIVTGIYYVKRHLLRTLHDLCRCTKYLDMNVFVNILVDKARNVIVKSVNGTFLDLGTVDDYSKATGMLSEVNISTS